MAAAVSVLIPAYRAQSTIARPVRSLLAQTMPEWEAVIIADDGQDYEAILQSQGIADTRLRFTTTGGTATGVSHARNTGLKHARSNIIAMLDADDAFYPEKLRRMVPLATLHGCCACPLRYREYASTAPRDIHVQGLHTGDALLRPDAYLQLHYAQNAMLVFDQTRIPGGWREDLPVMEDLVFSLTAYNHIPHIYHVNEVLHEYVYTENSLSTGPSAPPRFIAAKKKILEKLEAGTMGITNPEAASALRRFTQISLEIENEYAAALAQGKNITFTELLALRLRPSGSGETGM